MSNVVLEFNQNTFDTLSVPDSISVKKREVSLPFKNPFYKITVDSKDIVSVLGQIMKPSVLHGTKQFAAAGVGAIPPFSETECDRPLGKCQIIDYAIENNIGVYVYVGMHRDDEQEYYDYAVTIATPHGKKPKNMAYELQGMCDCCKRQARKMCDLPQSK